MDRASSADAAELDWWMESSEGDVAVVAFSLPEKPVSVVVMNADGSSPVQVEWQRRSPSADCSGASSPSALVGIGLLNLGVLMLFRARARRRRSGHDR